MRTKKNKVSNTLKPFTSVEQVAQETGIAWRTAKARLKAAGLLPIEGRTRAEILDAIKPPTGDKPGDSIKEKLVFEQWRKFKLANDEREGLLISKASIIGSIQRLNPKVDALIEQKIVNEYPAAVAGLDVPAAREFGKRFADELRREWAAFREEWQG
jgi:hypothetical protein